MKVNFEHLERGHQSTSSIVQFFLQQVKEIIGCLSLQIKAKSEEDCSQISEEVRLVGKVDWVFKLTMPTSKEDMSTKGDSQKKGMLQLPKSKLSGSREWLTNLFSSPSKSRSNSIPK